MRTAVQRKRRELGHRALLAIGREFPAHAALTSADKDLRITLVVLFITLSKGLDDLHNRVAVLPWFFDRKPQYGSYKFIVPGLTFHMFFGMQIPAPQRRICSAREGFLYMTEEGDAAKLETMARMAQRSERKGTLGKKSRPV